MLETAQRHHPHVMFDGEIDMIGGSGSFDWFLRSKTIQPTKLSILSSFLNPLNNENWESLCYHVSTTTALKNLTFINMGTWDRPPADVARREAARTNLLLDAMDDNQSIVRVKFANEFDWSGLWCTYGPPLIERNRVRAIATAPDGIRRQLLSKCLGHDIFQANQASIFFMALRLSEMDEDFTSSSRIQSVIGRLSHVQSYVHVEHAVVCSCF
jgi:hypothetical protein